MRWCIFAACVLGFSSSGCFNPKIKPGGFACSTPDPSSCPSGFYCVDGLCQDHPGGGGGGGGVGGNGGPDLSSVAVTRDMSIAPSMSDMATATSMPDLSQQPDDMTLPPDMLKCKSPGSLCASNSTCCSKSCGATIPFVCD